MIKVIAFDFFGTVFDMSKVPKEDIINYVKHLKKEPWTPLVLPDVWETLHAYQDSLNGIEWLREHYTVVSCTNAPIGTQIKLCKNNGISFDGYIPLELNKTFKTKPESYMTVCEVLKVKPEEVMMVTANKEFGDLEASKKLGMTPVYIRHDSKVKDIEFLAALMQNPEKLDLERIVYTP